MSDNTKNNETVNTIYDQVRRELLNRNMSSNQILFTIVITYALTKVVCSLVSCVFKFNITLDMFWKFLTDIQSSLLDLTVFTTFCGVVGIIFIIFWNKWSEYTNLPKGFNKYLYEHFGDEPLKPKASAMIEDLYYRSMNPELYSEEKEYIEFCDYLLKESKKVRHSTYSRNTYSIIGYLITLIVLILFGGILLHICNGSNNIKNIIIPAISFEALGLIFFIIYSKLKKDNEQIIIDEMLYILDSQSVYGKWNYIKEKKEKEIKQSNVICRNIWRGLMISGINISIFIIVFVLFHL